MENTDNETLSSAFSRCVIQLRRTIRSYVVEPTPAPMVVDTPSRSIDEPTRTRRSIFLQDVSPMEPEWEPIVMLNDDDDTSDTTSIVTAIRDEKPDHSENLSTSESPSDTVVAPTHAETALTKSADIALLPTRVTLYTDKITELVMRFFSINENVSPYSTSMASWLMKPRDDHSLHKLEWRLQVILDILAQNVYSTHEQRLTMASAFIHTQPDMIENALAMSTVGGLVLLLRASHLSRSPDEVLSFMGCEATVLNKQLFDRLNQVHLARCILIDFPRETLEYEQFYHMCAAVTVRALYGIVYTMTGNNGVGSLDKWLRCSQCYVAAVREVNDLPNITSQTCLPDLTSTSRVNQIE